MWMYIATCRRVAALVAFAWLCLASGTAHAQTVTQYANTTTGTINGTTTCTAPLIRTFSVTGGGVVADIDLGVFATHSWRGDIRATLVSPSGTRVQVIDGDTNAVSGDNLNVMLSDENSQIVNTDAATGNHSTTAPLPYANNFRPNAALSAFDGQSANGTWQLELCDLFPTADDGVFQRAHLVVTTVSAFADLSLGKTVSNAAPAAGATISYTLSVTNSAASPNAATGVTVTDVLPAGFTFVSATGAGSYNNGTGIWTVGTVSIGATVSITITGTVSASAGVTVANVAQISASSQFDPDSTPANGVTTEDDYAAVNFTVGGTRVAGTPPVLSCPNGTTMHDWDSVSWTAGSLSNSYSVPNIGTVPFNIAIAGGSWLNNATYGGQSPARQNVVTGGFGPAQFSIFELVNFTSQAGTATTTVTLPNAVPGVQFRLFDIDYNAGQFADRVTVTGTFNGAPVTPILTNGVANYVIGNSAFGDAGSADASANGNVVVTFNAAVDTIVITYGNHALAPADPGQQAIAVHDFTFCRPFADISVSKISMVQSDGVSGANPKSLPGATVRYCITVTNNGSATATSLAVLDGLPPDVTYVAGSLMTGSSCGTSTTAEDDNASGADENDPLGAAFSGATVSASAASLAAATSFSLTFNVTVD